MRLKAGVKATGVKTEILLALNIADAVWARAGKELVVTSLTEGAHSGNSRHYIGMAADLRTRYFSENKKADVFLELKDALGSGYGCVYHDTHIHVQYNGG